MRITSTSIIVLLIILSFPSLLSAVRYNAVITGADNPDVDISAVQKAIDKGGSILLKGVFDFGDEGSATIGRDVEIIGETDAQGAPATKIKGGRWTFQSRIPTERPLSKPGPKIAIRNIQFEGALWAPISLPCCGGADISNNKILHVRPVDSKNVFYGQKGILRQQGVIFVPLYTLPEEDGNYLAGAITGDIHVNNNDIDLGNDNPEKTLAQGVLVVGATGADIRFQGNRVVNASRNGLESLDNYPGENGSGMTLIQGNTIITPTIGVPLPSPATPNGIITGWYLDPAGASDPDRITRIIVRDNHIESRGQGERSVAIAVISDDAIVASNRIKLEGCPNGVGIFHCTSNSMITDNKVEGAGMCAIMIRNFRGAVPKRNVIMNNDYSNFKASMADVLIQGESNISVENTTNIVDEGQRNQVIKLAF